LAVTAGIVDWFAGDEATGLGWCSPVYGRLEKSTTVRGTHEGKAPFRIASVFGLDPANPVSSVEWLSDTTLRITRAQSTDEVVFTDTDPRTRRDQRRTTQDQRPMTKDEICAASLAS